MPELRLDEPHVHVDVLETVTEEKPLYLKEDE
jgi:hypothetical protein